MSAETRPTHDGPDPGWAPPDAGPPPPGEWLFQAGGQVYGPVGGPALVELIWSGRVDRATPVSTEDGAWRPLAEAPGALLHLAKAEARARVEADLRRARRRAAARNGAVLALLAAVLLAGGWLVALQPWRDRADLLDDLGPGIALGPVRVGTSARAGLDEVAVPAGPARPEAGGPPAGAAPAERGPKAPARRAAASGARGAPRKPGDDVARTAPAGPGTSSGTRAGAGGPAGAAAGEVAGGELVLSRYDPRRIEEAVARQRGSLAPCLREEARRSPEFSGEIPIEFAVGNDGKVAALWIDEPRFKSGPLRECLLQRLQGWSFDPFPGSRPVVSLTFRVGPP